MQLAIDSNLSVHTGKPAATASMKDEVQKRARAIRRSSRTTTARRTGHTIPNRIIRKSRGPLHPSSKTSIA